MSAEYGVAVPKILQRLDAQATKRLEAAGLRYRAVEGEREEKIVNDILSNTVSKLVLFLQRRVTVESDWQYVFRNTPNGFSPQDEAVVGTVSGTMDFVHIGLFTDPYTDEESNLLSVGLTTKLPDRYGDETVRLVTPASYITRLELVTIPDLN